MRVGSGYDVHRLVPGRRLVIGGVDIPHAMGLLGYSDADVLLHAICDALLGAAALGDIGEHFPDTDNRYKDISSLIILGRVGEMLARAGFVVGNIDSTVVAEKPRLASYMLQMRENIAGALALDVERINVKATTTEGLGFEGREEGISAQAVVLIEDSESGEEKWSKWDLLSVVGEKSDCLRSRELPASIKSEGGEK